CMQGLQFPWTF
nr:immunoglobulin light chain junction region [Macaca mulatta]MOX51820.1 immunoglobulin light chain junction region [Macaca mulatta]MOX51835.1 immunoglobulin light chain junction region [Macaca mulatta]MOX51836.1 immunoglobulin light chain junction region [Macaca mulatta]MOX52188.1 immunoglobulin light chain junction region [Macaca mulatta]